MNISLIGLHRYLEVTVTVHSPYAQSSLSNVHYIFYSGTGKSDKFLVFSTLVLLFAWSLQNIQNMYSFKWSLWAIRMLQKWLPLHLMMTEAILHFFFISFCFAWAANVRWALFLFVGTGLHCQINSLSFIWQSLTTDCLVAAVLPFVWHLFKLNFDLTETITFYGQMYALFKMTLWQSIE